MVHADATYFARGVSKEEAYEMVLLQAEGLFEGQRNWVCNTANAGSLLWHAYKSMPSPSTQVNWTGFYTLDPTTPSQLILGPFHGKVACQTIRFGRGVCGAAAETREIQLVPDVENFPGHIVCDSNSRSEIVVPIVMPDVVSRVTHVLEKGRLVAVIDVDCAVKEGFDEVDRLWLGKLAELLARSCDW